jgi:hypothetical protein
MSLIHVRRSRKRAGADAKPPKSPKVLAFLLVLVVLAIWYIPRFVDGLF